MNHDMLDYQKKLKENISILVENEKLKEGKELLAQYEKIVKDDIEVYSIKGVIAMMEGDMDEAEGVLKKGLALDERNFDLLYNLGYLFEINNNRELTIKYYEKALRNGKNEETKDSVYEILKGLGIEESKKEIIKNVINEEKILLKKAREESNPSDQMKNLQKQFKENIQSLMEQGLLEEAKELLTQYEQIVKDDIDVYSIKGTVAMMEGKMDEAFTYINKGLVINPNNIDLLYNKAYLCQQVKEYKESYRLYKNVIKYMDEDSLKEEVQEKLNEIKRIDSYADLNGKLSLLAIDKRVSCDICNFIISWFHEFGFTILRSLDTDKLVINKNHIKKCIIMYDLNPKEMQLENKMKYPEVDNERYFLIEALQKQLLIEFGIKGIENYLYLTKNETEAKNITHKLLHGEIQELHRNIKNIEEKYRTKYPVVKLFDGFRHRAKTELINYRDGLAVKKTWKPGNEKFIEREKLACGELSKTISYIPPLLEEGENYIIIPYYNNLLLNDENKKRVLTTHIVDIAYFLKQLFDLGYFNPDIHPGQFVFSKEEGVKAIDFEYLQEYDKKPDLFIQSYDIAGYPKDFNGDKPNYIGQNLHEWYNDLWMKYTGYTLKQIANLIKGQKYNNDDSDINKVLGLLNYAKSSGKTYNGSFYGSAYHSFWLKEYYFRGQREPNLRLQKVPYDFSNKTVLDIGCNAGGMLHALADKIKVGIGIDYDYRLVNVANAIKTINNSSNLSFYRFDLENEDLNLINSYVLSEGSKIDICFLLSVCMWIKNWREVIAFVASISNNLLFETNGTKQQQLEQIEELKKYYKNIEMVEEESNDDPGQPNRKLLFCTKRKERKIIIESNIKEDDDLLNQIIKAEYEILYKRSNGSDKVCKIYTDNEENNTLDFKEYMKCFFDFEFYRSYVELIENKDQIKGIITGLSYFEVGIDTKTLKKPFVNLALSFQDLFYDFSMLKHAIEDCDSSENIRQVIIGLSNYSFRYDLSMTQNPQIKEKAKIYYPILKKLHNYPNKSEAIESHMVFEKEFNRLFQNNYVFKIFKYGEQRFNVFWESIVNRTFDYKSLSEEEKQREVYSAKRWNQKYLNTMKENIEILKEMLKYLKDRNIKTAIVTSPATNFYKNYFPENCREEFINIIGEFKKEFEFSFIDGYNMNCFHDSDFYDASHLNKLGAVKFTKIINESLFMDEMENYKKTI